MLCDDPRFTTNTDRLENRDALIPIVAERLAQEPTEHWIALLEPIGVPCASINRLDQAFVHPQVVHRELQINLPHTTGKTVPLVANPIKFSQTEIEYTISADLILPAQAGEYQLAFYLKNSAGTGARLNNDLTYNNGYSVFYTFTIEEGAK